MMFVPPGRVARQLDARLDRFGAGVAEKRSHAAVRSARSRPAPRPAAPAARSRNRCPTCAGSCCACSVIAATTSGCEWPVALTAMPAAQSRNTLPSTSSTIAPGAALDDERIAARVGRRDDRASRSMMRLGFRSRQRRLDVGGSSSLGSADGLRLFPFPARAGRRCLRAARRVPPGRRGCDRRRRSRGGAARRGAPRSAARSRRPAPAAARLRRAAG